VLTFEDEDRSRRLDLLLRDLWNAQGVEGEEFHGVLKDIRDLVTEAEDSELKAAAFDGIAYVFLNRGRYGQAAAAARVALATSVSAERVYACCLYCLGPSLAALGQPHEASEAYFRAFLCSDGLARGRAAVRWQSVQDGAARSRDEEAAIAEWLSQVESRFALSSGPPREERLRAAVDALKAEERPR
jgi:tetratricopeptide (TPR) repeat protein